MMPKIENPTPGIAEAPPAGKTDKLLLVVAVAGLGAMALAFWAANGPGVFAELMTAAWALCF